MKKILIDRPLHEEAFSLLSREADIIEIYNDDWGQLEAALKEVDGVICSAALKMTAERIGMSESLQVIGRPGAGYDSVDVDAATKSGIPLVYTPDGPTESVAEHVILLMLMCAKKINSVQDVFKSKGDFGVRTRVTGMELEGKTLGLAGFGRIGRRAGSIASAGLGMNVLVFDPFLTAEDLPEGYKLTRDLGNLSANSDFISLHMPFNDETRGIFGKEMFAKMKPEGVLINTARGGVVDEEAMIDALKEGRIGGAGLDVYGKEPPDPDNPLLKFENVVATPHLSSFTDDGKRKMGVMVVQGVLDVLNGKEPECMVNRGIWNSRRK
ncbi:MAG: hydroxyacid dehydrogenase [Spirochaetales bacterium]|nr:hydroxyacid dehydrogenase [Spirochaetales bacterium]